MNKCDWALHVSLRLMQLPEAMSSQTRHKETRHRLARAERNPGKSCELCSSGCFLNVRVTLPQLAVAQKSGTKMAPW